MKILTSITYNPYLTDKNYSYLIVWHSFCKKPYVKLIPKRMIHSVYLQTHNSTKQQS